MTEIQILACYEKISLAMIEYNTEKSPGGLETCSQAESSERSLTNAGVKNSSGN